jgi:ferritin
MQYKEGRMLSREIYKALNDQVTHEFYASHLYLAMSAYFESQNLPGFARWMRIQSEEERGHAMRFFDYITDRGNSAELQAIAQPPSEFQSPLDVFQQALAHEQRVTALIHKIYELALNESDYATQTMLHWFITEQVEEEKTASQIIEQLKLTGGQSTALLLLDRELGARGAAA